MGFSSACCRRGGGAGRTSGTRSGGSAAPLGACDARLQHRVFRLLEAHSHPSCRALSPSRLDPVSERTNIYSVVLCRCPEHREQRIAGWPRLALERGIEAQTRCPTTPRTRPSGVARCIYAWPACEHAPAEARRGDRWCENVQGGCEGAAFDRERRGRGARCGPVVPRRRADGADCFSARRRRQACREELFARRQRSTRRITGARACMRARAYTLASACMR